MPCTIASRLKIPPPAGSGTRTVRAPRRPTGARGPNSTREVRRDFDARWNRKLCQSLDGQVTGRYQARPKEEIAMHSLIYIVGLIVVIVFVLSLLGLA